ncbi:hypothetical protein WJX84_008125 [Apatococcus fuscideae]|uniref:Mitochondrial import inner membrane translocase subunit TIM22 n=1 Tax=Apatococcus fuscideae TaxID=2026836 RepID=A0AAW1SP77_9CHLO
MSTLAAQKQEEERQKVQKDCVWEAAIAGGKAAAWAGLCSVTTIGLANHFSEGFRHALGVSGKAALMVTPVFGMYFLQSQLSLHECARRQQWANLDRRG